jgi:hypothetical protein
MHHHEVSSFYSHLMFKPPTLIGFTLIAVQVYVHSVHMHSNCSPGTTRHSIRFLGNAVLKSNNLPSVCREAESESSEDHENIDPHPAPKRKPGKAKGNGKAKGHAKASRNTAGSVRRFIDDEAAADGGYDSSRKFCLVTHWV